MGKIEINYLNGGIGGIVPSTDYISGIIFDSASLPTGFSSTDRIKSVLSLKDAENLGITNTSVGETKATGGALTISAVTASDVITVTVQPNYGQSVVIGTYSVTSTDTTSTVANKLARNISLKLGSTGWAASSSSNVITLTPPKGLGASINGSGVLVVSHSKTSAVNDVTTTAFSNGVGSKIDIMHNIIESYFNANPQTRLWIGIYDMTAGFDASTIASVQTASGGEIRQIGIWSQDGLEDVQTIVTSCQSVAEDQATKKKPLSVILGLQPGTASASTLTNISTLTSPRVSVTISNAYGSINKQYRLKGITGLFPTDLGQVLGHVSRQNVGTSIAFVNDNILENADSMLVTGEKWIDIEDTVLPDELGSKGYIYQKKYFGRAGSYFDNDSVADAQSSDYNSIKRMRVMDKVARIANAAMTPFISGPLVLKSDGTLTKNTIDSYTSVLIQSLTAMANRNELSAVSVYINPAQDVLTTNELVIDITVVPIGSADTIVLNLGYSVSI